MSYPHNETPLCHQHGCPDHGRRETEWMHVSPDYYWFQLYYLMPSDDWMKVPYGTCEVYTNHKYTHHLCPHHDTILINTRWDK